MNAVKKKKRTTSQPKTEANKRINTHLLQAIETSSRIGGLFALEERIMFDGAAIATGAEVVQEQGTQDQAPQEQDSQTFDDNAEAQTPSNPFTDTVDLLSALSTLAAPSDRKEIVFIDTSVDDYHTLMEGINPQAEVILLDPTRDGMEQIAEILGERSDIDAVHLISHGDSGELRVGTGVLNVASMQGEHADELAIIKQALAADADWLIYGCHFGEGEAGKEAAHMLADLTGADIAASSDLTGSADLGGDWDLEYEVGVIDRAVIIDTQAQVSFGGLLDITSNLQGHWTLDSNANDASGNGNNGTLAGDAAIDTTSGTNKIGDGKVSLDGAGDYVNLSSHVNDYSGLTEGTIAAWVRPDANSGFPVIFEASDSGDSDNRLALLYNSNNGELIFFIAESATQGAPLIDLVSPTNQVPNSTWTHVAVTVDSTLGTTLYVNGNSVATNASTHFFDDVNDLDFVAWGIDKYDGGILDDEFDGFIDDARIYDRALSSSDIAELQNSAPVLDNSGSMTPSAVMEDNSDPPGDTVAAIIASAGGDRITDVDGDPEGIAVIDADNTNGDWQYSLDGGSNWLSFGAVSASNAVLLDAASLVRFVPAADYTGAADLRFRAWDQSTGSIGQTGVNASSAFAGGSSAFSSGIEVATVTVDPVNDAPVLTNLGGDTLAYTEGGGAQDIEQGGNAAVSDVDSANFDAGTLTVSFQAGSDGTEDELAIRNQGTGVGQLGVSGSTVTYNFGAGAVSIGTFAGGGSGGGALVMTLNSNADATAVGALIQNITYTNTDTDNPTTSNRTVRYVLTDGDGGTSVDYDTTVTVTAVNDSPVAIGTHAAGVIDGGTITMTTSMLDEADVDDAGTGLTYTITSGPTNGQLELTTNAGVAITSFTQDDIDNNRVIFVHNGGAGAGSFNFSLADGGEDGAVADTGTFNFTIAMSPNTAPSFNITVTPSFTPHNFTSGGTAVQMVSAADVDGDGDMDALAATNGNEIEWYENDGNGNFTTHTVAATSSEPYSIATADVDGDGDLDVLSALALDDTIAWYENDGNESFTAHTISTSTLGAYFVDAEDIDGDGDMDVVAAAFDGDQVLWYENDGNESFTTHTITSAANGATSVTATDVDGDGDIDVLSSSLYDDKIAWYENDGNENFSGHIIATSADAPYSVVTADVDSDGDVDVLSASWNDSEIAWYENDGYENFTPHTISNAAVGAKQVAAADVDGDGDMDVLSASFSDNRIAWYENDGDQNFTTRNVDIVTGAVSVATADFDDDGNLDVLAGSASSNTLEWQESSGGQISTLDGNPTFVEGGAAVVLDADVQIFDHELTPLNNFGGTSLTLVRAGGANAEDVFSATGNLVLNAGTLELFAANVGTYTNSGGTLVLTFAAGTTNAQVNEVMRSIAYANSSDAPPASVDIEWTFSDGNTGSQGSGGALTTIGNTIVTITQVNDAPIEASIEGTALAYAENDAPTAITSTLTLSDVDDTQLDSAVIQITSNYVNGEDLLAFINQNGIIGNWNATTGTLSLSGIATLADYQSALRSVTYQNSSDDPSTATRTVSFTVNDGDTNSNTLTRNITVTAVNDVPVITNLGGDTLAYTEGGGVQVIEQGGNAAVSDVDSANFDTGTLTVSFQAGSDGTEDELAIRNQGAGVGQLGVSGSTVTYNFGAGAVSIGTFAGGGSGGGPLVMTFNSNADATAVGALIQNITYTNTDTDNPTTSNRTVRYVLTDGDGGTSVDYDTTVTVTPVNDAPVSTGTHAATVAEGSTVTLTTAMLGEADVDDSGTGLTYTVTTGPANGQLELTTNVGVAITSFTQDDIDNNRVVFVHDGSETLADSFDFRLADGGEDGAAADTGTFNLTVTPVNDVPVISGLNGDTLAYTEGDGSQVIEQGGNAAVSDVDSANFDAGTLTVSFQAGSDGAEDELAIRNQGTGVGQLGVSGSTVTYNFGAGAVGIGTFAGGGSGGGALVMTFNSNADATAVGALIQNITYTNTDTDNPTTSNRTVRYVLTDGDGGASADYDTTVTVTPVNDAPVITALGGDTLAYTEGDGAVVIDQGASAVVNDVDSSDFDAGTLTVSFEGGEDTNEDVLAIQSAGNVSVIGNTVLYSGTQFGTFTGGSGGPDLVVTFDPDADATAVTALLNNITYENTDTDNPTTGNRTVRYVLTDGDGGTSVDYDTTVTVTAVNDAPVGAGIEGTALAYTENDGGRVLTSTLTLSDADDTHLDSAVVQLTGNYVNGEDVLAFTNQNGIAGSWNAATGTLHLSGTATVTDYQSALRSVTYANSSEAPSSATRTVSVTVNDGASNSNSLTRAISVTAVNDVPVLTSDGGGPTASVIVEENQASVTTVTATDVDGDALVYRIIGGADAGAFAIDEATGALRFAASPDYEQPTDVGEDNGYEVQVQVSDGQGGTDTQALVVTVADRLEGAPPPSPDPLPEPSPDPITDLEPMADPMPKPEALVLLSSSVGGGSEMSREGAYAHVASRGPEERVSTRARDEVSDVLDLPPLLRPKAWLTTVDQIRAYYTDPVDMMRAEWSTDFLAQLNAFSEDLEETIQEETEARSTFLNMVKSTGLMLSTGLVAWMVRGGALLGGMMAAIIPSWRYFDPVPILGMDKKDQAVWARRVKEAATMEAREHQGLDQILRDGKKQPAPATENNSSSGVSTTPAVTV